jgi:ubiquinone/menaquinone biosynthesis C-methylase UbiE
MSHIEPLIGLFSEGPVLWEEMEHTMSNHASATAGIMPTEDGPRLRAVPDSGARLLPGGRPSSRTLRNRSNQVGAAMTMRSEIYARPDVYDMEYANAGNDDARFFARLLARFRPRRVLELACGSGRVTLRLATALPMAEIVGVDSSIDMLGKAAAARDAADPLVRERVSLVEGDMRDWPGTGDVFDAVIIPCCSVSHLLTLDDRLRTWATAFRLLRPGGIFILDIRTPDLATLAEAQRVRPRAFVDLDIDATRRTAREETRLLRCTATTYEPHLQRADVRLLYDRFDQRALAERLVTDFANHVYFPAELELLFLSTGFEIAQQYGDYRFVRVDRTSPYVVTVARRPRRSRRVRFRRSDPQETPSSR